MGLLKKLGGGIKKGFKAVKKVASVANPAFGAAYDAIGGKDIKKIGSNFVDNNMTRAKGSAALAPIALSGGAAGVPILGSVAGGGAAGAAGAGALGGGGALGAIGGWGGLVDLGLAGWSAYEGHQAGKKADKANEAAMRQQQQAIDLALANYGERAPLRKLGMDLAMNQTPEDVSSLYVSENPFAKRRRLG